MPRECICEKRISRQRKEVKRVLNIEKYKKILDNADLDIAVIDGKAYKCSEIDCEDCDFFDKYKCKTLVKEWLFSEYEEPEVDWSIVKVDTPILVKDILKSEWIKRYFAKYENGRVYAWKEGKTSWSAVNEHNVNSWKYAKLAESEEI